MHFFFVYSSIVASVYKIRIWQFYEKNHELCVWQLAQAIKTCLGPPHTSCIGVGQHEVVVGAQGSERYSLIQLALNFVEHGKLALKFWVMHVDLVHKLYAYAIWVSRCPLTCGVVTCNNAI